MLKSELKISRFKFIKILTSVFFIPIIWVLNNITNIKNSNSKQKYIELENNFSDGLSFIDQIIVVKEKNKLKIFSSKCTHLGCKITFSNNNQIICPCHGSKYSLNGEVIDGPSTKNLINLEYSVTKKNKIKIELI